MFTVHKKHAHSQARLGILQTASGSIQTPVFMPIATRGVMKMMDVHDISALGPQVILANTYHLLLNPGPLFLKKWGGLHKFMRWTGALLTDSGGYQVFSLSKLRKITEEGVMFSSPIDGSKHMLSPETSIAIQQSIGSDIMMAFDECPGYPATKSEVKEATERTTRWAMRCKEYKKKHKTRKSQLLFGIVQGGIHKDLRQKSAKELVALDFDGYAVGGVAVGEPRSALTPVLKATVPLLPEEKPRYLMGLGRPEEIIRAVSLGIDMFDCVIPTREARHGRIFAFRRPLKDLKEKTSFYKQFIITNAAFKKDNKPLEEGCPCMTCQTYSRAYIHYLFKIKEGLAQRLCSIHNVSFYLRLMQQIRDIINVNN